MTRLADLRMHSKELLANFKAAGIRAIVGDKLKSHEDGDSESFLFKR